MYFPFLYKSLLPFVLSVLISRTQYNGIRMFKSRFLNMYLIGPDERTDSAFVFALNVFASSVSLSLSSLVFTEMSEIKIF